MRGSRAVRCGWSGVGRSNCAVVCCARLRGGDLTDQLGSVAESFPRASPILSGARNDITGASHELLVCARYCASDVFHRIHCSLGGTSQRGTQRTTLLVATDGATDCAAYHLRNGSGRLVDALTQASGSIAQPFDGLLCSIPRLTEAITDC